ncbi:DNA-binding transcriptional activator of the SARP family [Actinopolyspora mzabensis]|uniref:DNA-binding transcriptional activator of the SARP family n=1 Tax=Actinopolyspora mzabensis TaxID=995066 RepID=A0A1G8Y594_ACTMZ|nr:AfsR/SARP family transcriptional regulator [Actinopolyspora mzabensis]SDJ98039.1 DNA-binding transcriptional activator of the SARP family [Actinopolyspora mzabensis]
MRADPTTTDRAVHEDLGLRVETSAKSWFSLLGELEIRKDGIDHAPTAPKLLQIMALLILQAGKTVHTDSIIWELWSESPPRSVRTAIQTYVYQLRRSIEENGLATNGECVLETKTPGYRLCVSPEQIDVFLFQRLCSQGREEFEAGLFDQAAASLRAALSLCSGNPMANVRCGPVLLSHAVALGEQRRNALHLRIQAEIELGEHRDLVAELRSLAADSLDETVHMQLMQALSRSGRRPEALGIYRDLRTRLVEELGLEPSGELQRLHRDLLSHDR